MGLSDRNVAADMMVPVDDPLPQHGTERWCFWFSSDAVRSCLRNPITEGQNRISDVFDPPFCDFWEDFADTPDEQDQQDYTHPTGGDKREETPAEMSRRVVEQRVEGKPQHRPIEHHQQRKGDQHPPHIGAEIGADDAIEFGWIRRCFPRFEQGGDREIEPDVPGARVKLHYGSPLMASTII
jgi:hypothetical protein